MIANTEAFSGYLDRLGVAYKYIERHGKSDLILLKYRICLLYTSRSETCKIDKLFRKTAFYV